MLHNLWSLPIYYSDNTNDDVHSEIHKIFEAVEESNGFYKRGAWDPKAVHVTDPNFFSDILSDYNSVYFKPYLISEIKNYLKQLDDRKNPDKLKLRFFNSWLTKTVKGDYLHLHNHGAASLSGVYYVKLPEDANYKLYFNNPIKTLASSFVYYDEMYNPRYISGFERRLILFPGWLDHYSHTYTFDDFKVSFSFNIAFDV